MGQKFPGISVSGYLSAPPSDDGSITDANKVKWATHVTKIGNPLYNSINDMNAALVTAFAQEALLKTANYTTTATDNGKLLEVTGTNTISLLDASTGGASYQINVLNTGVGVITVSRATAGNTINGVAQNWTLNPGNGASFRVNSTLNGYHAISTAGSGDVFAWGGTAGGTANALTISVTPAITALVAGQIVRFITGAAANTLAATLAVNGLTATAIVKEGGAALAANDLPASTLIEVVYNGTNYRLSRPGVLLSGAALTDVIHNTGDENIGGVKTLTSQYPLILNGTGNVTAITGRNLTFGVQGYWRFFLGATDGRVYFQKNTHAAGDFSTNVNALHFDGDDMVFAGTIVASAATLSTELVTKGQLDAKVYGGRIANNGTASVTYGPSGWTVSRSGVGLTTITHNLGTTNYSVVCSAINSINVATPTAFNSNTFLVTTGAPPNTPVDYDYSFVLARN